MSLLHLVVLALVQGITEFLPISSSGHLILVPKFTDWPDQGLEIDIAVHVGTLIAVMLYFWRDIWGILVGLQRFAKGKRDPGAKLAFLVVVATIPVVIAGVLVAPYMSAMRLISVIGWTSIIFGIALWVADRFGLTVRKVEHITYVDAIIIGVAQALALIPGTSRSGITMTAARMLGYERAEAARFSMVISIPTILAAGSKIGYDLYKEGNAQVTTDALYSGGLAFASALVAIWLLMAWLKRASFTPFVLYRVVLGVFLLAVAYGFLSV